MVLFAVVTNVTIVDMRPEWLPSLRLKCTSQAAIKATLASASALKAACLNKYKDGFGCEIEFIRELLKRMVCDRVLQTSSCQQASSCSRRRSNTDLLMSLAGVGVAGSA